MSYDPNTSGSPLSASSPNYKLAREFGYELSKEQFSELYNYARMVQKEHSNEPELSDQPLNNVKSSKSPNSKSSLIKSRSNVSEDFWIKYLRESFECEFTG